MSTQQELIDMYIKLRDKKKVIADQAKADAAKITEAMDKIEVLFLKHFNEEGVDSVKTEAGTVYKSRRVRTPIGDWDAALQFIRDNDMWHMLEHRLSKAAIEQFRDEHDDLPPGVGWQEETVINVRRS